MYGGEKWEWGGMNMNRSLGELEIGSPEWHRAL